MKSDLLPEHRVCLLKSPADWKEIIRQGCRLMEEDGVIAAGFYPEIIRQMEKLGPYMVLADGFALPHLVSAGLVHEAGFVLMISPQSALKTSKFKEFWRFFVKNYDCAVGAEKEACFWNKVEFEF